MRRAASISASVCLGIKLVLVELRGYRNALGQLLSTIQVDRSILPRTHFGS